MDTGQWQQAEDLLKKSLADAPDDAATRRSLAEVLWHRDDKQAAMAQMELAMQQDSDNASLRVRAGEMSLTTGARESALSQAERAIRSDPQSAEAWALRGRCFKQMNQPDRALADLQHALDFAPNDSEVLFQVATIYRERGEAARSLTTIHHLLDTYSPGEEPQSVLRLEGLTLMDLGRSQQACDVLAAAARRGQPDADGLYYLAQAYAAAGRPEQATEAVQQALALNAAHVPSRQLLAQLAASTSPGDVQRR
jgi:tetratricopeptide (TPR) repeat protein